MKRFNDRESGMGDVRPFSNFLDRIGGESRLFLEAGAEGGGSAAGGEGGEGDNNTQGNPPGGGETYTKEQMDNYMNSHLAKARKSWERDKENIEKNLYTKLGISGPEEIERFSQLREEAEKAEQRKQEEKGQFDKILADKEKKWQQRESELTKQISEKDSAFDDLVKEIRLTNLLSQMGADPSNLDMIVAFTKGNVKVIDKNTVVPVDSSGEVPLNTDTGKDMTLEDYLKGFLGSRPNLVKPSGGPGGGSSQPRSYSNTSLEQLKEIASKDPKRYAEMKASGEVQKIIEDAQKRRN